MQQQSRFEHPKMALIRLLRSEGCCTCEEGGSIKQHSQSREEDIKLLKYKEELTKKLARQKERLKDIPCVLTLAQEIQELTEVINGLGSENKERLLALKQIERAQQQNIRQIPKHKSSPKGEWEYSLKDEDNSSDIREHQRLQAEYTRLLKALEVTNDKNQRLIAKLTTA